MQFGANSDTPATRAGPPAGSGQFSLRALLLTVAIVAAFIGLYVHVWRFDSFLPALFTTAVTAAFFLAIQRRGQKNERLGAILGGAVGGVLSIALDKIARDVHLPGSFEDEGLGAFGVALLFSPVGAVFGMIVGFLVWVFAAVQKLDAESA